jgi:N utilization substance protein A
VDTLHRDKEIDRELVFQGLEAALASASRKQLGADETLVVTIDRQTGKITAREGNVEIEPATLGRIAAQTAKQVMIQKIREAERDVLFADYEKKIDTIVNGTVHRFEGSSIIANLGRTEAILPKSEQIPGETYHVGERIRALVLDATKVGSRVRVVLTRNSPEFVASLFELEVPEIAEKVIEIKALVREPGFRTKIAVFSNDAKVDCVGACVGVRGSRIKNIVDELNGEKIDIIQWEDAPERLICNALKPAEIASIILDEDERKATVIVADDQVSLAIGRRGQNVRLASKLCGWNVDITTQSRLDEKAAAAKSEAPSDAPAAEPGPGTQAAPAEPASPQGSVSSPAESPIPPSTELQAFLKELPTPQEDLEDLLTKLEIKSVQDLAAADVEQLGSSQGLGPERARELIELAQKKVGLKSS